MKTFKIIINIIAILLFFNLHSNAQSWQWSQQIGSNLYDGSKNVLVDNSGNSYWSGSFMGVECFFQNDTSNVVSGINDSYIIKVNPTGNLLWWKQIGGNNNLTNEFEGISAMAIDDLGNLYVTGNYWGNIILGSDTLNAAGYQDVLLAKFDNQGNSIWAKRAGSIMEDAARGIALDNIGNIYICGTNSEPADFDSITIPPGGFIAKYDTSGNCQWAKNKMSFTTLPWNVKACNTPPSGLKYFNSSVSIAGYISVDTVQIDSAFIYSNANYYYISSFDTSGTLKWIKTYAGPSVYYPAFDHSIDGSGAIYSTGSFGTVAYFDTDTLNSTLHGAFIVKRDSLGNELWVRGIPASGESVGFTVSADNDGDVYCTGKFSGSASFGNYNVTASTTNDMYVARYNSNGDCLGVRTFGQAEGYGVTQDNNGNAFVCGTFDNTVTIGGNTYTTYGDKDIFIAKLDEIVGIEEINGRAGNQLLIYANPNAGKCNITVPDEFANEQNLTLSIFNLQGQLIQQQPLKMSDGKIKVNLSAEAKGVYNVTLSNGVKVYYGKIIFE